MRVQARVCGEWFLVPCKDGLQSIRWLGEEAIRRYCVHQFVSETDKLSYHKLKLQAVRKFKGVLLHLDDIIKDCLDDNDSVTVVLSSDQVSQHVIPEDLEYILQPQEENFTCPDEYMYLDGSSLSTHDLVTLGKGLHKIKLTEKSEANVIKARLLVEQVLKEKKVVYGISTGPGKFARTVINTDKLEELQYNIITSHATGVGPPLSPERTRMLLALRINVLAKGYSGISLETLQKLIDAFNCSCLSLVPSQGSVGASGDLAPLSHLALGLLGEGQMWSPQTGWGNAKEILEAHNLQPIKLHPKEGVCLINGTQLITSLGAEAVERAYRIAHQADAVAALTLEMLKGTSRAFDPDVQHIRPHKGQIAVARTLRALLHSDLYPSEIAESHYFCDRVQDPYSLRCCPQVHGIAHDTIEFVKGIITVEMNSGTDNPIVLPDRGEIISAGNFHGEYPAKALDYLAIAIHELASISERRTERLVNPALSELPAFLVKEGGLNSGFMLVHMTAAALVSENKVLCHPASVDSISTNAGTEDHVSMGCFAARKALQVVENVERVIAIELLTACQAMEFLRPLKTTAPLEEVYKLVRSKVRPLDQDRYMTPDMEAVTTLLRQDKVWEAVRCYIDRAVHESEVRTSNSSVIRNGEKLNGNSQIHDQLETDSLK